jgi:hypothetical protein
VGREIPARQTNAKAGWKFQYIRLPEISLRSLQGVLDQSFSSAGSADDGNSIIFYGVAIAVVWPQDQSKSARKQLIQKLIKWKISRKKKCDERQAKSQVNDSSPPYCLKY